MANHVPAHPSALLWDSPASPQIPSLRAFLSRRLSPRCQGLRGDCASCCSTS